MIRLIFLAIVAFFVYRVYVSPFLSSWRSVSKDDRIRDALDAFGRVSHLDVVSYEKAVKHAKSFISRYSSTFHTKKSTISRLEKDMSQCLRYLRRIASNTPNDAHIDDELETKLHDMSNAMESYIVEAAHRLDVYYFPKGL